MRVHPKIKHWRSIRFLGVLHYTGRSPPNYKSKCTFSNQIFCRHESEWKKVKYPPYRHKSFLFFKTPLFLLFLKKVREQLPHHYHVWCEGPITEFVYQIGRPGALNTSPIAQITWLRRNFGWRENNTMCILWKRVAFSESRPGGRSVRLP